MYIDTSTVKRNGKNYTRHLLRRSYREDGKVKKETVANLSHYSDYEIETLRLALQQSKDPKKLLAQNASVELKQGQSIGALLALKAAADEIGLTSILNSKQGSLALWQIFVRLINQGSRLASVRLAQHHAISSVLGLEKFNEDDLYENLDWLSEHQNEIEEELYKKLGMPSSQLFLYDVTSSYLEGVKNELAQFGYNRDKKKGKAQIVIGLLCNDEGIPITIRVFEGNTPDQKTMSGLIEETAARFGIKNIVWVGDRGMIKSTQIDQINSEGFNYITAITKPQIESLIKKDVIQLSLFDSNLMEVEDNGIRYIMRKNPVRMKEIAEQRNSKHKKVQNLVLKLNKYLQEHSRAKVETALKEANGIIKKLGLNPWLSVQADNRTLVLVSDEQAKQELSLLDGCYVLKTDLTSDVASKEVIHSRYKDLGLVECAFRTFKTGYLDLRPLFVQRESRTRGHVFVVMLAYRLAQVLSKHWKSFNITVEEGIKALCMLCLLEINISDKTKEMRIPEPTEQSKQLLEALNVKLPKTVAPVTHKVSTKKTLKRNGKT